MRYGDMSKKLALLESTKRADAELCEVEFKYDEIKEEIIRLSNENPTLNEEQIIDMLIALIKEDMGSTEEEVIEEEVSTVTVDETFEQLIEYVLDDESFEAVEINEEIVREHLENMIQENPKDSKETIAWVMKGLMKDEMVF